MFYVCFRERFGVENLNKIDIFEKKVFFFENEIRRFEYYYKCDMIDSYSILIFNYYRIYIIFNI